MGANHVAHQPVYWSRRNNDEAIYILYMYVSVCLSSPPIREVAVVVILIISVRRIYDYLIFRFYNFFFFSNSKETTRHFIRGESRLFRTTTI